MGKGSDQQLPVVQPRGVDGVGGDGVFCCQRCRLGVRRIAQGINLKCAFVVLLTVALSVYALFSVVHLHSKRAIGFDAEDSIKRSATVQAYFRLPKPVSEFVSQIPELEGEIFQEIAIPSTKVAILSMHQESTYNWTDVVFGVLSNPSNASITTAYLSLLRSTFLDIFDQQYNLTLTNKTFGQPSSFELLKFPGGVSVIPDRSHPVGESGQLLFNFTLNNSIAAIKENSASLKTQLRDFLGMMPDEAIHLQVTNIIGSTRDPPVVVQTSVSSNGGAPLSADRLMTLGQRVSGHPKENLGLDHTVFGKVKEVRLSSNLNQRVVPSPSPSPSPSPGPSPAPAPDSTGFSGPSMSPSPLSEYDPSVPKSNFRRLGPYDDSDVSSLFEDIHAFSLSADGVGYNSLPRLPNEPASTSMPGSSKELYMKGVAPSTSGSELSLPPVFLYIAVWWICWFGFFTPMFI